VSQRVAAVPWLIGAVAETTDSLGAGAVYLVFGPVSGVVGLSAADAKLLGEDSGDQVGISVASASDVDGDGLADLLTGSEFQSTGEPCAGAVYVVRSPVVGDLDLSMADLKLHGETDFSYGGLSSSPAGDADQDGCGDILVGAMLDSTVATYSGAAYLILAPGTSTASLSRADAKLLGEAAEDYAGRWVAGAGDADADGLPDILVGAHYEDSGAVDAGATVLGRDAA
jgi:hypothetical protein